MNWDRVAAVFLFVGLLGAGGGFVWWYGARERAADCRESNVMAEIFGNATEACTSTTPPVVLMAIGAVFFVVGGALALGASQRS